MTERRELLSPIGEAEAMHISLAPRLGDLNGKVIGLLNDDMLGSTVLLDRVKERLQERFKLAGVETEHRFGNKPAGEVGKALAQRCDFAVCAVGC